MRVDRLTRAVLGAGLERAPWCVAVGRPELGDATVRRVEGRLGRTEKRIDGTFRVRRRQ